MAVAAVGAIIVGLAASVVGFIIGGSGSESLWALSIVAHVSPLVVLLGLAVLAITKPAPSVRVGRASARWRDGACVCRRRVNQGERADVPWIRRVLLGRRELRRGTRRARAGLRHATGERAS